MNPFLKRQLIASIIVVFIFLLGALVIMGLE